MTNLQAAEQRLQDYVEHAPIENQVPVIDPEKFHRLVSEIVMCARIRVEEPF